MAYRIILNKRFVIKSGKIAAWIEQEWSKASAEKFVKDLYLKIESLRQSPFAGMPSAKKVITGNLSSAGITNYIIVLKAKQFI